jgi:predicted PurR-regulated permease PerM
VNTSRQAPESAEIRAQEKVRTQDEETRTDRGPGDEPIQAALEEAAEVAEKTGGLGSPGRPVNRRSPFMIGLYAAFGVAVAYGLIQLFIHARSVLILIGLAFFIAAGLDPVVGWLVRHGMPRWAAVLVVIAGGLGIVAGFLAAAIPPLASEAAALAHQVPHYLHDLQDRNSQLGTFVAFLDLIPVIGSTVGGIVVSLVALTVSLPVALGTLGFYVFYRLAEDYLIVPRIQGRTVELPALASLVAVLIGGVLLGIVGVLVAIPVAAAIRLLLQEVAFPRLDKS